MKTKSVLFFIIGCLVISCASQQASVEKEQDAKKKNVYNYPESKREMVKDTYHGEEIVDYYRWLENSQDPAVKKWTEAQNAFTEKTIMSYPQTKQLEKRLKQIWNYDKMKTPVRKGDYVFYRLTKGLQNHAVLYAKKGEEEKVLVDPNSINKEGTTALDWWYASPHGKYIAYGLSENGSEQSVLHVVEVATGKKIDTPIPDCRYASVGWTPEEAGFFYTRKMKGKSSRETDMNQSVRYHKIGNDYKNDTIIAESTIKEGILLSNTSPDGKWLLITEYKGSSGKARLSLYNVITKETRVVVDNFDNIYDGYIYGDYIYLKTDKDNALNWKIERVHVQTLAWETFIPEHEKDVIDLFAITSGKMIITYMHDVASQLKIVNLNTKEAKTLPLPVLGSIHGLSTTLDREEAFFSFSSYAYPPTILRYTKEEGLKQFWQAKIPVDPSIIETKQVFYKSKDGTSIPMFIIHKKGIKLDGNNPCVVKGYGGFNVTYPLYFSSSNFAWLEQDGILAIANIRGGGEYGEKWHRAGMLDKKQNTFDDFAWALKYLTENNYTNPEKLGIWGGSNGGLLTGAMVTQYPELFKAALVMVPLLDMLRFHRFLIGRYWVSEYGSSDEPEQYKYIRAYSPYQNVKKGGKFPGVYLTAGEHDSRVHPLHAKKMTALLQHENKSENPIFLTVELKAGHGQGKSTDAIIHESAMEWGFYYHMFDMNFTPVSKKK